MNDVFQRIRIWIKLAIPGPGQLAYWKKTSKMVKKFQLLTLLVKFLQQIFESVTFSGFLGILKNFSQFPEKHSEKNWSFQLGRKKENFHEKSPVIKKP